MPAATRSSGGDKTSPNPLLPRVAMDDDPPPEGNVGGSESTGGSEGSGFIGVGDVGRNDENETGGVAFTPIISHIISVCGFPED